MIEVGISVFDELREPRVTVIGKVGHGCSRASRQATTAMRRASAGSRVTHVVPRGRVHGEAATVDV